MERWLACARRAFAELDPDGDGVAQADDIVACLRAKLPPSEVRGPGLVAHALVDSLHSSSWSRTCFGCCVAHTGTGVFAGRVL